MTDKWNKEPIAKLMSGDRLPHFGPFSSWNFGPWNHHANKSHTYKPIARRHSAACFPNMDSKWDCRSSTQSFAIGSASGFTLIELLVVLVIITLLATLVGPKLFSKIGSSKIKVAGAQIELLTSGLDTYRLDVGHYPATKQGLAALRKAPNAVKHWDGPYLSKPVPLDPWDYPYHYKRPGKNGPFALYTLGRDGKPGGKGEDQDIGEF